MAEVERVQTGIRLEKRLLKVLKGIAEMHDMTLGDLIEGICLHALDGRLPFGDDTLAVATKLKDVYRLDLGSKDAHRLVERAPQPPARAARRKTERSKSRA